MRTDFLVIGSGIAGLSFAIKIAQQRPESSIIIITKSLETEGS
ncbi:MAG TPA: FAD-binding protein, partial [Flavobacteriales bacterium]|nr:FAD-binding protein [Flavobacteriales bacterium]